MSKKDRQALVAQEAEIASLKSAQGEVYSNYTLLQRQLEDLMYIDLAGPPTPQQEAILPRANSPETLVRLRRLRHENPIAKQAVKLTLRFTFGRGVRYLVKDDDQIRDIVESFWSDPTNQVVLCSRFAMIQRFDETLTDGEIFLAMFTDPTPPYVRMGMVPIEQIKDILYDPDNDLIPVWYKRVYHKKTFDPNLNSGQGGWKTETEVTVEYFRDYRITDEMLADIESRGLVIPEEKQAVGRIKHRMINPVRMRTGWRGVSELYASREWIRVFKEFMEDRGGINAMANALSMQRKVKGGPAAVARISGKIGGLQTTPDDDQPSMPSDFRRLTRPAVGSIYDTNDNVDLKSIRIDTGAIHAQADANMLLMAGGSGMNTSSSYFGGSAGSLAGAQVMELPMVKGYEDYQTGVKDELQEIIEFVLSVALGRAPKPKEKKAIAWQVPPIITQDVTKYITAFAQLSQQIAPGNRVVRELAIRGGLNTMDIPDGDIRMDEIMDDEERIQKEKDEMAAAQLDRMNNPLAPPQAGGGQSGAKDGPPDGQKSGGGPQESAISGDQMRLQRGRPPREAPTGPRTRRR